MFVEAAESAQPEVLADQVKSDGQSDLGIKSMDDIKKIIHDTESLQDHNTDNEIQDIVGEKQDDEESVDEQGRTPDRFEIVENGEVMDKSERNLDELRKSVDRIVQNLERSIELEHNALKQEEVKVKTEENEKKFSLFEKLGQCMERENRNDEELRSEVKQEVKEELKNEILNELKSEMKTDVEEDKVENEQKW